MYTKSSYLSPILLICEDGLTNQGKNKLDTYIVKPNNGAMGRGIFMAQTEKDVDVCELTNSVAQLYIRDPLVLNGYKCDLRIYVLIAAVDPLKVG